MVAPDGLADADRAMLHATRSAWQRHQENEPLRQAMRNLVLRLTDSGVRQQTIAAELGVTTATVGMRRSAEAASHGPCAAGRPQPTSYMSGAANRETQLRWAPICMVDSRRA